MDAATFLQRLFRGYYAKTEVKGPPAIEQREFGFGGFGQKISQRHVAFMDAVALNNFLREQTPFYISYSNAYYEFPDRKPMEAKNLLHADLVYEFDADDLRTDCKKHHDSWHCKKCGARGPGLVDACTGCGERPQREEWVCSECLGEVKQQVFRLLELLENDLGISDGLAINSSGGKGFHVHVRGAAVQNLSQEGRIMLLDYVSAFNPSLDAMGFYLDNKKRFHCPSAEKQLGWPKRILGRLRAYLDKGDAGFIAANGRVTLATAKKILSEKKAVFEGFERGILYPVPGRSTEKFWLGLLHAALDDLSLPVDRQTSVDIRKIVRVPDTLHGSTGLLAKTVSRAELKGFDLLRDGVVFGRESVRLKGVSSPRISLGGESFGPFEEAETDLPAFAAAYLLARGAASLQGENP